MMMKMMVMRTDVFVLPKYPNIKNTTQRLASQKTGIVAFLTVAYQFLTSMTDQLKDPLNTQIFKKECFMNCV